MSNPIKSLLATPLSVNFIANANSLNEVPLSIFKFLIDSALSITTNFNPSDEAFISNILQREKTSKQLLSPIINALKTIHSIMVKVLKLMKTSQPQQIQSNLENCQKYLATTLSQNTLLEQTKITYFIDTLAINVHKSLQSSPKFVQTDLGSVSWSIYSLKKTNLSKSQQNSTNNGQQSLQTTPQLKTINKMYVKLSFGPNFTPNQIHKLITSSFKPNSDSIIQANLNQSFTTQQNQHSHQQSSRTVIMSLIDFRLLMEEIQKIKNLNF